MAGVTADFAGRVHAIVAGEQSVFQWTSFRPALDVAFALLTVLLYLVSREMILAPRSTRR